MSHQTTETNAHDGRYYKNLLLAEQHQRLSVPVEDGALVPSASALAGDSSDIAVAGVDAEVHAQLLENYGQVLTAIEAALLRIRQGRFGICITCEQPIGKPRLEAVPWTSLCRNCQELEELS